MTGLYEILHKIKDKPGMYLGRASIVSLRMFLCGYECARGQLGIEPTEKELDFHGEFHSWIQKRFEVRTSKSWADIILLYSVDEKEAFYYFFELLEKFLNRDRTLETDELHIKSTAFVNNSTSFEATALNPSLESELASPASKKEVIVSE